MKPIEIREADFKRELQAFTGYNQAMLTEFFDYWTEPNKSGTKMRFELEKTWHLGRRLARWAANSKTPATVAKIDKNMETEKNIQVPPEIVELDKVLQKYTLHPTSVEMVSLAVYYDYLKNNKLMRTFTKEEIETIRKSYPNDNQKCRACCVQMTFDGYVKGRINFKTIYEARTRLNG